MSQYICVDYKEDAEGQVTEIKACIVEGDHEGPDQVFRGPKAVEDLKAWAAREYPHVTAFTTSPCLDKERIERVRKMLRPDSQ